MKPGFVLFSLLLLAGACATAPAGPKKARAQALTANPSVAWAPFEAASFERAEREGKLVLLDVGMEGCTACRWMDEDTYRDPRVVALMNERFVAISVDSEARPDIGQRYARWGWPATIFLGPGGAQVLALRGNRRPRNFLPILRELLQAQEAGTLEAKALAPLARAPRAEGPLPKLEETIRAQLDGAYEEKLGGWGAKVHLPLYEPVAHALYRARVHKDAAARTRALTSLESMGRLIDPVWGGVFVAAIGEEWEQVIPEKRMAGNTGALTTYADAYRLTGEARWIDWARDVERYLRTFMMAPDGTFYTSQEDVAPRLPKGMTAAEYYTLGDAGRRQWGIPPIDHATYTTINARAIIAFVHLHQATGDPKALATARRAGLALMERQQAEGWFANLSASAALLSDDRIRPAPLAPRAFLEPQGWMGLALLELANVTGEARWLEAARTLAGGLRATLEDPEGGGFYDRPATDLDRFTPRLKPLEANATAARFLLLLGKLPGEEAQHEAGLRALRSVAQPAAIRRGGRFVGNLALATALAVDGAIELSVVGARGDPVADALFDSARAVHDPRKVVHYEVAGRYPKKAQAALYICDASACSQPITDPKLTAAVAEGFRRR